MQAIPRKLAVCAVLGACAPATLDATQDATGRLLGIVTDALTSHPIEAARVIAIETGRDTLTDVAGRFVLADLPTGKHTVEVERSGYEAIGFQVELTEDLTLSLPAGLLALAPRGHERDERRAAGRGVLVERGDITGWRARSVTEVLRHIPGLRIQLAPGHDARSGNSSYFVTLRHTRAECSPIAFLDGAYLGEVRTFDLDATISVGAVEAIEIYRGTSAVPPRFDVLGAQCGVIAFWTQ